MHKKTTKSFIKEAKAIWGNQNDYSSAKYIKAKTNVEIRCCKHDLVFPQTPGCHLRGRNGCPECRKENSGNSWKGYEEISLDYFNRISKQRNRCSRVVPFKLKIEDLWELYIAQNRKCALTGWEIFFKTRKTCRTQREQTASLDRIKSNGIYEIGNVQWVHKDVQKMKWDLTNKEVIKFCRMVRNNETLYNR